MSRRESDTEYDLPVEDDWFASPADDRAELPFDDLGPYLDEDRPPAPPRRPVSSVAEHRPLVIVAGIVGAVALIAVAVVLARALSGTDGAETTSVPTIETPPTTAPTTTEPAATTPAPTTPTGPAATEPTTPPASPPATVGGVTLPEGVTLRPGDTGESVQALQQALAQLGYDPGAADGDYGPATQQAVIAFQQAAEITADGVVGPETLAALAEALSAG